MPGETRKEDRAVAGVYLAFALCAREPARGWRKFCKPYGANNGMVSRFRAPSRGVERFAGRRNNGRDWHEANVAHKLGDANRFNRRRVCCVKHSTMPWDALNLVRPFADGGAVVSAGSGRGVATVSGRRCRREFARGCLRAAHLWRE